MSSRQQLPGTLDALRELPDIIGRCAQLAGLSTHQAGRLRLAADELITNAVVHGYEEAGRTGVVDVDWSLDESGRLVLGIEDDGLPFDPTEQDDPDHVNLPLAERPIGGLGIMLARQSVDDLRYRLRDGRNRVELVVAPAEGAIG